MADTDVERSNARLHVLAEASRAFALVATEYPLLLPRIARTTADLVGDGCIVTLIGGDGESLINVANAHRDPGLEADYRAYLAGMGVSKTSSGTVSAVVARTGEPRWEAQVDPTALVAKTDAALKPLVTRLNVHSYAVAPIRARHGILGTLSLVRSGPGRGYSKDDVTLLQDLADRAGMAIETARLYDDLEQRVRERTAELETINRELEAFSYSVSHDLRAPLRAIDGFTQAIKSDYADRLDDQGRHYLDRVLNATHRMGQLIEDLLSLSRVTRAPMQRERVDLTAIARHAIAEMQQREPQRHVAARFADGLFAYGDPRLLRVMVENLLGNAWKFTSKRPAAELEFGKEDKADGPVFFVRDNGAGFDMQYASKLFKPFQRLHTDADFDGTGIGLAIVQRVAVRHGGRVWAESTPGEGATFSFTLEGQGPNELHAKPPGGGRG
jgi:signal transduction histidine kinase